MLINARFVTKLFCSLVIPVYKRNIILWLIWLTIGLNWFWHTCRDWYQSIFANSYIRSVCNDIFFPGLFRNIKCDHSNLLTRLNFILNHVKGPWISQLFYTPYIPLLIYIFYNTNQAKEKNGIPIYATTGLRT